MALRSRAVAVTDAPTRLDTADETYHRSGQSASVYNNSDVVVYLGGDDVSTANGTPIAVGAHYALDFEFAEGLYAIVASGSKEVRVLEVGVP